MNRKPRRNRRLYFLLVLAAIIIPGVFGYIEFYLTRPTGDGPAGPPVDSESFTRMWTNQPVQVVGLGDSITAGLGAKSPSHTFFNRVIKNPKDEYESMHGLCLSTVLPNLSSLNLAISGSESDTHLEVIRESLPRNENAFGLILMTSGGNDLIHSYGRGDPRECAMYTATLEQAEPWIRNFETRLNSMFDEIRDRFPAGCEIFIGDIYDPTDGVGDAQSLGLPRWQDGLAIHRRYNDVIRKVASERDAVHVVPLHQTFLGHGSHCRQFWRATYDHADPHFWFYSNIEDPNDRGYDAIRRVFLNAISQKSALRRRDDDAPVTPSSDAVSSSNLSRSPR